MVSFLVEMSNAELGQVLNKSSFRFCTLIFAFWHTSHVLYMCFFLFMSPFVVSFPQFKVWTYFARWFRSFCVLSWQVLSRIFLEFMVVLFFFSFHVAHLSIFLSSRYGVFSFVSVFCTFLLVFYRLVAFVLIRVMAHVFHYSNPFSPTMLRVSLSSVLVLKQFNLKVLDLLCVFLNSLFACCLCQYL
jgi:hypothetical protein